MKLKDRVAFITGADSGIGHQTAIAFAKAGADVAIGYHTDEAGAKETKKQVEAAGRKGNVLQVDIGNTRSVDVFFDKAASALGAPDILVANAGVGMSGMPVADMEDTKLEQILRVDLMGPVFCARPFIHARKEAGVGGRLLFIGSVAGHLPTPGSSPYGMAKAGVNSLVRSLSVELAPDRINVNAIAPGLIATPMTEKRVNNPEKRKESEDAIPWKRVGQPEEIAQLALFLVSDDADYMTGQTVVMDGGLTMNWAAPNQARNFEGHCGVR